MEHKQHKLLMDPNRSITDHCNNSRTHELTSFFSPPSTFGGFISHFSVLSINYTNTSCAYSTSFRQCKTSRDHVLLHHQDVDRISIQYLQGSPSLLTGGMPFINAVQWYLTVYILTEAGLLVILQEGIKVQADFTLCNMMRMVSVDTELQSSCLLLDRQLEDSCL